MPWDLVHNHPACRAGEWAVVNRQADAEGRHSIEGCHPSRERALAQQRALYANEPSVGRQAIHEVEQMEIRRLFAQIESKAITDQGAGEITGMAAVYGNVDLQDDLLEQGSLAKSAEDWSRSKSRMPLLDWHGESLDRIIGSVTQLKSIAQGVWFKAGFTADEQGQRARQLAKDGHLSGVSIGWLPIHASLKVIGGKAIRAVREAKLLEISLTPIPANPEAQLASVKSLGVESKAVTSEDWSAMESEMRGMNMTDIVATHRRLHQMAARGAMLEGFGRADMDRMHAMVERELRRRAEADKRTPPEQSPLQWGSASSAETESSVDEEEAKHFPGRVAKIRARSRRSSSLTYDLWAPAMRKALDIEYTPAAKAAAHALLGAYQPDGGAGFADGQPTPDAAADTGPGPAAGTAEPSPSDAAAYALAVANPGPRDDAPTGPADPAGHARQLLEDMRTKEDLDALEGQINQALGREQA